MPCSSLSSISMLQTNLLPTGHADLVADLAFDFYGERLATCSADQRIKVWRKSATGSWDLDTEWKAHDAPILSLCWSHPELGSLIATSSYDRTVRVWEEASQNDVKTTGRKWVEKGVFADAKGSVRMIEFAGPSPSWGLRLASISTDSHLRLYTSLDPSLSDWSTQSVTHIPSLACQSSTLPANEADDAAAGGAVGGNEAVGGWGLSFCRERWWGAVVAVCTGQSAGVKIVALDPTPHGLLHLLPPASRSSTPGSDSLTSISWAPSCGRSYHLIATGSRDGTVRVWKVIPAEDGGKWKGEMVGNWGSGGARIGRVEWNVTGTILTSADDDGKIKLYKSTYANAWKLMGKFSAEEPTNTGDDVEMTHRGNHY